VEERRGGGYVSIHERRLELWEGRIWHHTRHGDPARLAELDGDTETIEIDSVGGLIAGFLGVALHGILAYFPYLFTLFVAPLPVIVGVYASWAVMLRVAVRRRETHPWLVLALPIVEVAVWFGVMQLGWTQLGWPSLWFPENGR
jgi:hypothetical protein